MKSIVSYLLLICIIFSPSMYARPKARPQEVDITPPLPSDDEFQSYELNKLNEGELVSPPPPYSYPPNYCSIRNKKNNPENDRAKIAISTGVLLGIAILGMIFVARDSH